jgi:uncharacterized DUF497 family protein
MKNFSFEWDEKKSCRNLEKHAISFYEAQNAFLDPNRIIAEDLDHSDAEKRYYCFGEVGEAIMTVRFTYRHNKIRIFGAGFWRKGKKIYEKNKN